MKNGNANKNPAVWEHLSKDPYYYNGKMIPGTIRALLNA